MDGRGRCMDNIFIERLWRSLKYEAVYLHELRDGFEAERVIAEWINFYNAERPHSSLNGATRAELYAANRPVDMMDKLAPCPHPHRPSISKRLSQWIGFWQHDQKLEYTLTGLPDCPTIQDQLTGDITEHNPA